MDKKTGIIVIKKAILHTIKNNGKIEIRTYNNELDLNNNNNKNFIIGHIQKSLKSDSRKIADFNDKNHNKILNLFNAILYDENNFIKYSKDIARELGTAMEGTNATSTYLLITVFSIKNTNSLAILKLNFVENIELLENTDKDGDVKMELVFKGSGVPDINRKLEKGAFISNTKLVNEDKDYDLVLLDKNNKEGSTYFKKRFLNCELVNSPIENITSLFKTAYSFVSDKCCNKPNEVVEKIRLLHDYINSHDLINVVELNNFLSDDDESKENFINICAEAKIDFEFKKDNNFYNKKYGKMKYETNTGIIVEGDQSAIDDKEKVDIISNEDGTYDIKIKGLTEIIPKK